MPTYVCRVSAAAIDEPARERLAGAITRIHSEITGADGFFAQVLFHDIPDGACFLGGRRLTGPHCFIHGHIRAGRSARDRADLIGRLVTETADILAIAADDVWVYVAELPPRAMAEYGRLLPEPGDEAAWLADLPQATRERLRRS